MGHEELIASLRKEGEEKVRAVRDAAEVEADNIRAAAAGKIEQLREEFRKREARLTKIEEDDIISSAEKKARTIILSAEKSLSDRLFNLALICLHELRRESYENIFSALVKEIPQVKWEEVRVHSADAGMARRYFPGSVIVPDDDISGGFEAALESGRRHIINTFEKRLERAWEEILPSLVIDTYKEASRYGIPSGD
ncbi:MAG: V-type ATP synthase subunit E [Nitrospirae bacterium]|nr:V-type ATP synthase subunit E [Nitrospirota bacterium]